MMPIDLKTLVGLGEQYASIAAQQAGYTIRVTKRDGQNYIVTRDYRTDRINFHIEKGEIVKASIG